MPPRRSTLPLLVGALIAVLLHALALPLAAWWLDRPVIVAQLAEEDLDADKAVTTPPEERAKQEVQQPPTTPPPKLAQQDPPKAAEAPLPRPDQPNPPPPVAKRPPAAPSAAPSKSGKAASARAGIIPKIKPGDLRPGMDDSPEPLKVTWISHKDYEKMIGPLGPVEQPAIQQEATPVPGAPLIPDPVESKEKGDPRFGGSGGLPQPAPPAVANPVPPSGGNPGAAAPTASPPPMAAPQNRTPPAQQAPDQTVAQKSPPKVEPPATPVAPAPLPAAPPEGINPLLPAPPTRQSPPLTAEPATLREPRTVVSTAQPPTPPPGRTIGNQLALAGSSVVQMPEVLPKLPDLPPIMPPSTPAGTAKESPDGNPTPGAPPSVVKHVVATTNPAAASIVDNGRTATGIIGPAGARPSGAPRAKGEVSPSSLISAQPVTIRAGAVWAGEGLQIHPVVPRTSVGMMYSVPNNPRVQLTFNRQGDVIAAKFLRSTGSDIWDAAILAASYRWKASGKKLALIGPEGTEQEFTWLLGGGGSDDEN